MAQLAGRVPAVNLAQGRVVPGALVLKLPYELGHPRIRRTRAQRRLRVIPRTLSLHRNAAGALHDSRDPFMDSIVPCIGYTGVQPSGCGNLLAPMGTAFPFPRQGFLAPAQGHRLRRNGNGLA